MSAGIGLIGPNPKLYMWSKESPIALFESNGSLGKIAIDVSGVAFACLALFAASIFSAPLDMLFVGIAAVLLYNSCTRHKPGVIGTAMGWGSFVTNGIYNDVRALFV